MRRLLPALTLLFLLAACREAPQTAGPDNDPKAAAPASSARACKRAPPPGDILCTEQWDPVCGCDGVTYSNACHARAAGVPDFTAGECGGGRLD